MSKNPEIMTLIDAHAAFKSGNIKKAGQILQALIKSSPKDVEALDLSGRIMLQQGNLDGAAANFGASLAVKPENPACLNALGFTLFSQGQILKSEEKFRSALSYAPNFIEAIGNLGLVTRFLGKHDEALQLLQRAASAGGVTAKVLEALANEFLFHSQPHAARDVLSKLVSEQTGNPVTLALLGRAMADCGDMVEAELLWSRAQAIDPNYVEPEASRARSLQSKGDIDGAVAALERALAIDPGHALSLFSWAHVADGNAAATLPRSQVIEMIETALKNEPIPHDDLTRLQFAAGKLLDKDRNHAKAIDYYERGNGSVWSLRPVQKGAYFDWYDTILTTFDDAFFDRHRDIMDRAPSGHDQCGEGLIFIVGMPRSGTTLVEQIFSRADDLFAGGERPDMDALVGIVMKQLDQHGAGKSSRRTLPLPWVRDLAAQHHIQIEKISGSSRNFTDKSPRNFMNLGMIACLFPRAKLIHCVRNPIDTCLSCYFNYFGYNAVRYSYDLEALAHFYSLYLKMIDAWRKSLPISIFDVIYEDLVGDSETTIREMVKFGGKSWDEKFLHPEENHRAVHTASVAQVRNPINKGSVGRWVPYEAHLKPLLSLLGDGESPL
ncbi:MAG: tetratricopeptide repeat protein [Rhodospirillales bacterium]|nr:tetratricopeptide repeat protein [Rhodospirillales bacterium]MBT4039937.1 tetratricopeptide repeat protein [Rhodospirillales bacterium]MBT4626038.1 tetratricopeptide repeat protein [Rhodospirillales bacterium]MBT5351308.1 tetratricopeptide repeat protein [Rhodospirillales bacterium]MBT5521944.1 tetratricopeptide repeat protein [Rhodospirillales bacterium]